MAVRGGTRPAMTGLLLITPVAVGTVVFVVVPLVLVVWLSTQR
jgi:ABC-type sugar transport system permease subunit